MALNDLPVTLFVLIGLPAAVAWWTRDSTPTAPMRICGRCGHAAFRHGPLNDIRDHPADV
jgi:hypothetical protein